MFFWRRQVKKCKIHKKLKLRTGLSGFFTCGKALNPVPIGKLDWSNIIILAVFINPIMCYDLEK